ncbi:hypothetical protein CHS0354_020270 [Potamilus streckersoni]|uniref:Uncharacterized protein n=1 Tax=Potamilus streckersoni TaxID=2493646 RepID=A0AAE0VPR4_9BIVA|nr:hypothetical protein CHS0354_020270 [Potamilus streckersoni]
MKSNPNTITGAILEPSTLSSAAMKFGLDMESTVINQYVAKERWKQEVIVNKKWTPLRNEHILRRGETRDSKLYNQQFQYVCGLEDGYWGGWLEWSKCPVTCVWQSQNRHRACNNPSPSNGGQHCEVAKH